MKAPSPLFLFLQPNQKLGFLDLLHLSLLSPFQGFTFPTRHRCIHRSSLSLSAICMPVLLLLSFFLRCFGYGFFYFFFLRFGVCIYMKYNILAFYLLIINNNCMIWLMLNYFPRSFTTFFYVIYICEGFFFVVSKRKFMTIIPHFKFSVINK